MSLTGKGGRVPSIFMRCKKRGRIIPPLLRRLLAILLLCAGLLLAVDRAFGPVIQRFALVQAKFLAVTSINQSIDDELRAHPVSYDDLAHVQRRSDGSVLSVELDPGAVNDLSSRLTLAANAALAQEMPRKVQIPLGTVLGLQMLAGRGPMVTFFIQPASYVESSFLSSLEGAGFNQAMHNVVLRMTVVVETFSLGYHTSQTVISDMILAQTVIVGEVPDFYTQTA